MWLLPVLGMIGAAMSFIFLTLSIASGLYYLSELVEEHTRLASMLLRRLIYGIVGTLALLWLIDGLPFWLTLSAIGSHLLYMQNLRHFPTVKLTSPTFVGSCVAVGAEHWLWFRHFSGSSTSTGSRDRYGYGSSGARIQQPPSFTEIASFFGICVWLVPFALFVSLSAGENVLPSMGSEYATGDHRSSSAGLGGADSLDDGGTGKTKSKSVGLVKVGIDQARNWITETGATMGFWRAENVRTF